MDIKSIIGKILDVADTVNDYLPASGLTQAGIDLARKVEDLVSTIGDEIPLDQQAQAKATRAELAAKVKAKAAATSARMRGE